MHVRMYDEVDPYQVYRLTMAGFGIPWTPKYVRHRIRRDPRVLDGFAIYAVERNRPVAQVVPLEMPVRLTTGVETVGGIQAVCSLTSVWGKGYVRALMDHAHDLYRQHGLRLSTLMTSRNIRGYGIYRKMGYFDLATFARGTRRLPAKRSKPRALRLRLATAKDLPQVHALFERYARDLLGWTQRDSRVLPAQASWDRHALDGMRLAVRNRAAVGYVRATPSENVLAEEVVFPGDRDFREAIRILEAGEKKEFASVLGVTSARERNRYRGLGYELYGPMQTTVMALPLQGGTGARDLPRAFGVRQGRFILHPLDWF